MNKNVLSSQHAEDSRLLVPSFSEKSFLKAKAANFNVRSYGTKQNKTPECPANPQRRNICPKI